MGPLQRRRLLEGSREPGGETLVVDLQQRLIGILNRDRAWYQRGIVPQRPGEQRSGNGGHVCSQVGAVTGPERRLASDNLFDDSQKPTYGDSPGSRRRWLILGVIGLAQGD